MRYPNQCAQSKYDQDWWEQNCDRKYPPPSGIENACSMRQSIAAIIGTQVTVRTNHNRNSPLRVFMNIALRGERCLSASSTISRASSTVMVEYVLVAGMVPGS